ncbi:MAG: DUF1361 domain-containing protein [Saprospiraceae bacterium]|nr:DUF1361 domain-containing protein [Saprospiraceae bacterium]
MITLLQFWVQTIQQSTALFLQLLREPFRLGDRPVERIPMILSYVAMISWLIRLVWVFIHSETAPLSFENIYPTYYSYSIYLFLPWNLFLAWLPFVFSRYLYPDQPGIFFWPILGIWLLFLPNAPYLMTDFIHFGASTHSTFFLELLTFTSFSAAGIALGSFSLFHIQYCFAKRFNVRYSWALIPFILLLSAIGIFVGRVIRFNSWDALTRPFNVLATCVEFLSNPTELRFFVIFSLVCFTFLFLCYLMVYLPRRKLIESGDL